MTQGGAFSDCLNAQPSSHIHWYLVRSSRRNNRPTNFLCVSLSLVTSGKKRDRERPRILYLKKRQPKSLFCCFKGIITSNHFVLFVISTWRNKNKTSHYITLDFWVSLVWCFFEKCGCQRIRVRRKVGMDWWQWQ